MKYVRRLWGWLSIGRRNRTAEEPLLSVERRLYGPEPGDYERLIVEGRRHEGRSGQLDQQAHLR